MTQISLIRAAILIQYWHVTHTQRHTPIANTRNHSTAHGK